MMRSQITRLFLSVIIAGVISGCTKEDSSSSGGEERGGGGNGPTGAFATQCGTIVGGKLQNPASPGDGFRTSIKVLGGNLLSVTLPTGPLLVKLQNLSRTSGSVADSAKSALELLAREDAIFIPADSECSSSVSGGGTGSIGQVFTASGISYSESLITRGLAQISTDPCGGSLLTSCYQALREEAAKKYAGEIGKLLWKPVSDSNGRLAVHSAPYGASVSVNGEMGTDQGGGNGYGSLARFSKPGCAYGNNVKVQVFASNGAAYTFNGSPTITIPSGCNRTCLTGSTLAQCSK